MSLAREVTLRRTASGEPVLHQHPVLPDDLVQQRVVVPQDGRTTLTLTTDDGLDPLVLVVDAAAGRIILDRSRCGDVSFSEAFPTVVAAALPEHHGNVDVLVVVDASVVEVYALDGALTLTAQVFPSAPLTTVLQGP
jgi:sucrose-6-phosphate hydrolase SacC (GH32 family)